MLRYGLFRLTGTRSSTLDSIEYRSGLATEKRNEKKKLHIEIPLPHLIHISQKRGGRFLYFSYSAMTSRLVGRHARNAGDDRADPDRRRGGDIFVKFYLPVSTHYLHYLSSQQEDKSLFISFLKDLIAGFLNKTSLSMTSLLSLSSLLSLVALLSKFSSLLLLSLFRLVFLDFLSCFFFFFFFFFWGGGWVRGSGETGTETMR